MEDEAGLEIEALQSLMVDGELEILSDGSGDIPAALNIILVPDNSTSSKKTNYVGATLCVTYTAKYPEEIPDWKIEATKGLDPDMKRQLTELVAEEMQASIGMPMVFTVAEAIRSWLVSNNSPPKSMYDEMESSKAYAAAQAELSDESEDAVSEDEEQGTSHGLLDKDLSEASKRITKEQFDHWLVELRKEAILKGELEQRVQDKLTGRQLFEADSSLTMSDEVDGDADAVADMNQREDVNSLEWQNAQLFMDAGDGDEDDIEW